MPLYPMIDWDPNLLDPRGFYLNLCELAKKQHDLSDSKVITSEFLGQYQRTIFDEMESMRSQQENPYFHKSLRYAQIHNEFLFFAKRKLSCTNSYIKIWELLTFIISAKIIIPEGKLLVFFDAELPGNFVKGTSNFLRKFKNVELDWLASSLLPCEENTALEDIYGFYKDEPNWAGEES